MPMKWIITNLDELHGELCQYHDEIHKKSTISVKEDLIKLELWVLVSI